MISTIILTQDEERDIGRCLESLRWCDDIHVVDSGSTDSTIEIAQTFGAKIYQHQFHSFGEQRNWALDTCQLQHPWVLFLDADEVASPKFVSALEKACASADHAVAGFYCCWRMIWKGKWLKRSDSFPKWQFRVLRRGAARFTDFGHGQKEGEVAGRIDYISEPYDHFALSKGISHWVERHNRYSSKEAVSRSQATLRVAELFSADGSRRNKNLRVLLTRLPGGAWIRFFWAYFLKRGFLEGEAGFSYCVLLAFYEYLIKQKTLELAAKETTAQ